MGCRSVKGWYSGTSIDSQDTLAFSTRTGVRSMNETYPLDRVAEAYDQMMSGKARFRVALTIAGQLKCLNDREAAALFCLDL
jgi:D-arabinose 1-dehydrogenase-like Zn-dependent alcohol dehydrogenase